MTMDATPDHLDPDHLDDGILSALLDRDPGQARGSTAHLGACDRCAGRQAELRAARAALAAAPVEALDELTRRRLVAGALAAGAGGRAGATTPETSTAIGRSRRFQRHPALLGSAAAVLLALLVGIPFVVGGDGDQNDTTLSAQAPEAFREESAGSFLGDLGDLTDRDRLRLRLSGAAADAALGYSAPQEPGPSPAAGAPAAAPVPMAGPSGGGSLPARRPTAGPPAFPRRPPPRPPSPRPSAPPPIPPTPIPPTPIPPTAPPPTSRTQPTGTGSTPTPVWPPSSTGRPGVAVSPAPEWARTGVARRSWPPSNWRAGRWPSSPTGPAAPSSTASPCNYPARFSCATRRAE